VIFGPALLRLQNVWFARPWQIFCWFASAARHPVENPDFQGQFFNPSKN
jgi:hypothetical protein